MQVVELYHLKRLIKSVEENPFIPIAFQKDHKGMQGTEYHTTENSAIAKREWLSARNEAIFKAKELNSLGITKQLCNRLLEPFMWHTVIVSFTEIENFFALRCPQYVFEPENKIFRSWKDLTKYHNDCFGDDNKGEHDIIFKLKTK